MLKVLSVVTGILNENCYIAHNDKEALIIDPGFDYDKIVDVIEKNKLKVVGILITHHHFDHVGALKEIQSKYKEAKFIDYNNEGHIKISNFEFDIIKTPGHTLDSVTFYFEKDNIMFTGDFVFKETIGNYNSNNEEIMIKSLIEFKKYNPDIIIYPGHGDESTIGYELKHNPYLRGL